MNNKAQAVMDRLVGWKPEECKRIRRMGYYREWRDKAEWLDNLLKGNLDHAKAEIMEEFWLRKDDRSYGYAWKSRAAYEALTLTLAERGWK